MTKTQSTTTHRPPTDSPADVPGPNGEVYLMIKIPDALKRQYKIQCLLQQTDMSKQTRDLISGWVKRVSQRPPRRPRRQHG